MSIQDQMKDNQRRYMQRVEAIREDPDLNEHARHRYLKEAHREARTKHGELFEAQRQQITERLEKKRKTVLGPPHISGADKAAVAMSYRNALDRVGGVDTPDRLREVLKRAELTGDRVLAKAALYRGYELESEEAVDSYLNAYPEDRRVWDEFMAAAGESNELEKQDRMFGTLGPEPPRELGGVG